MEGAINNGSTIATECASYFAQHAVFLEAPDSQHFIEALTVLLALTIVLIVVPNIVVIYAIMT